MGGGQRLLHPERPPWRDPAIDGTVRVPERFAIDFVQLNDQNRLYSGLKVDLFSYGYYRTPVYSAAPAGWSGTEEPARTDSGFAAGRATIQMAGGNHVVVDIGHGRYAFYAHLATNSIRVRRGQKVKAGQVIGLLGNTGKHRRAPPSLPRHELALPLQSSGLPFVFRNFRSQGVLGNVAGIQNGEVASINHNRLRGVYRRVLPMENQVVRFGR